MTTHSTVAESRLARQSEIDKLRMSQILTDKSDFEPKVRAKLLLALRGASGCARAHSRGRYAQPREVGVDVVLLWSGVSSVAYGFR